MSNTIDFRDVVKYYKGLDNQNAALLFLEKGLLELMEDYKVFTAIWRADSIVEDTARLVDVIKSYKELPNQTFALGYLNGILKTNPAIRDKFISIWRNEEPIPIPTVGGLEILTDNKNFEAKINKILNRLKADDFYKFILIKPKTGYNIGLIGLEGCDFNLNPISDSPTQDMFNDIIVVFALNSDNKLKVYTMQATTEPGLYYTMNRLNPKGAARMEINFLQRDIWQVGFHKGKERALVQTGNKVRVRRDNNNDFNRANDPIDEGYFGINLHSARNAGQIGRWSAGCQVTRQSNDLVILMSMIESSNAYKLNPQCKFSYVLYEAKDVLK